MAEDKRALLGRLFAEHSGALRAFFTRRLRRHPDVADLAQEVYVRMLRIPDMGAIRNPEAYLYTVASNLAKEHAHQERRDREARDVDDPALQEQLAELPVLTGELDTEQRIKRLREGVQGTPAPFAPPLMFNVRLRYDWNAATFKPFAMLSASHIASMSNEPASSPSGNGPAQNPPTTTILKYTIPAYTTYDAAVGVVKNNWTMQITGSNLSNTYAATNISSAQFIRARDSTAAASADADDEFSVLRGARPCAFAGYGSSNLSARAKSHIPRETSRHSR